MVNVRGVNVYPSAVEAIVRRFHEVAEYRATVARNGSLRELPVEIEFLPGIWHGGDRADACRGAARLAWPDGSVEGRRVWVCPALK